MATALTLGGGVLQAIGSISQGNAARKAADINARNLEERAQNTSRAASRQEDMLRANARQVIGDQLALGGQSGVELSGSRFDTLRQSYNNLEADAAAIRTDAAINSTGMRNQAAIERWQGKQAQQAGYIGALASGLGSAGALYGAGVADDLVTKSRFKGYGSSSSLLKTNRYGKTGQWGKR